MFFLSHKGVLGINARNILYIRPSTPHRVMRVLDNKLRTKQILQKHGIPTPQTYASISSHKQLYRLNWEALPDSFALKPNRGFGGEGIIIVYGKQKEARRHLLPFWEQHHAVGAWVGVHNTYISWEMLYTHIVNILDGRFSLANQQDIAYFEERIKLLKVFREYSTEGIPDVRVIVYNGVAVMAQVRIPTKESGGKANLHLGAVGVGIDMGTGVTTHAVHHNKSIRHFPGNPRLLLQGFEVPHWKEILKLAIHAQRVVGSNFIGADISIDKERGPIVLELNGRPGLAIQIANQAPLRTRLERVGGLKVSSVGQGVRIAQSVFTEHREEHEETEEEIGDKQVIGIREQVFILNKNKEEQTVVAKIDTGAYRTTLCKTLAQKFELTDVVKYKKVRGAIGRQTRPIINLTFRIKDEIIHTEAFIADRTIMKHDMIIGRKDLKMFLVDPAKNTSLSLLQTTK